jgi:hypothetical protein
MKSSAFGCSWLAAVVLITVAGSAWSQEGVDPYGSCPNVFQNPKFGSADFRASCQSVLREHRAQLETWGVSTKGMTDLQAWDRYGAEFQTREEAKHDQERRDSLERERLAARRAEADAEQQRIQAQREKEANAAAAQQVQSFQKALDQQNKTLQGLGVNLGGVKIPSADSDDDEDLAAQVQMYKTMVASGVAPKCKGKDGQELIDCVDAALDEDDK